MTATIEPRTAKMAIAVMLPATGLGLTFPRQNEPSVNEDSATWDTLDSPTWNALARLRSVRESNSLNRMLFDAGYYLSGGTGAGEPIEFVVAEAQSNRFRKAVQVSSASSAVELGNAQASIAQAAVTPVNDVPALVAHVRSGLSLSITELAAILDVRRPTIYAWLRGDAQPQQRNVDRLSFLYRVSSRWEELAGQPLGRYLRYAFSEDGTTLFGLLKEDDPDIDTIDKHLQALAELPSPEKLPTMRELAEKHGLCTEPHENAELIRDIESGRRLTDD